VPHPPCIIIGMHRSGTSLLTSILEKFGLFTGHTQDDDDNHEAIFFRRLNEWLLHQANASWDNPYNFNFIGPDLKEILGAALKISLKSRNREQYLGPAHTCNYTDIGNLDFPWGWKDPRNTFTVDLWGEVFPDAKLLHIYRNPVDVAASLRQREITMNLHLRGLIDKHGIEDIINRRTSRGINFQFSPRVEHIEEGIKLWHQYVTKAFSLGEAYGNRCMHVKYEDFLEQPHEILASISSFMGITVDETKIAHSAAHINSNRGYAYTKNAELLKAHDKIKDDQLVISLGYNTTPV
jgi:Sulfotransferase family